MPTYQRLPRFDADWDNLPEELRERFRRAVRKFIDDLTAGRGFRAGLRVKRVQMTDSVFELTFAPDGRATWHYGAEIRPGEPHIVWRRIGTAKEALTSFPPASECHRRHRAIRKGGR